MPIYHLSTKRNRIYSRMTDEERLAHFWTFVEKTESCWIWKGAHGGRGYGYYGRIKAHRLSWEIHHGAIPKGLLVCHDCQSHGAEQDNRLCVNPDHLFLGTNTDNIKDASRKGRLQEVEIPKTQNHPSFAGERNGRAKLTVEQVREIRRRYANESISQHELAREMGIARGTIDCVVSRRSWQNVD